jgi:hypothetical protein
MCIGTLGGLIAPRWLVAWPDSLLTRLPALSSTSSEKSTPKMMWMRGRSFQLIMTKKLTWPTK